MNVDGTYKTGTAALQTISYCAQGASTRWKNHRAFVLVLEAIVKIAGVDTCKSVAREAHHHAMMAARFVELASYSYTVDD